MASTYLSKMVLKNLIFCQKAHNFVHFGQNNLFHILPACGPSMYQTMYGETSDFQCQQSFNCKSSAKNEFPTGHFMLSLLTLTLEV